MEHVIEVAIAALYIYLAWRIVSRAGYKGVWSLVLLIPVVNILMIYVFAFSNWPVLRNRISSAQ